MSAIDPNPPFAKQLVEASKAGIQQDFTAIKAKSEANGCSIILDFREKDLYRL